MNMKKLRVKIVLGVFLSATVVFLLTIIVFGFSTQMQLDHRSDSATELISTNGGKLPMFSEYKDLKKDEQRITSYDEESPYRMRYFIAKTNDENDVVETDVEHIAAVDAVEAIDMADFAGVCGDDNGRVFFSVKDDRQAFCGKCKIAETVCNGCKS